MFLLDQNSPARHSWKEDHDMMGRSWETPTARVGEIWYKSVSTRKGMWACHAEYWLGNAIILLQMACYHWRTHGRSIDTCAKQDDDYWSSVRPDLKTCFPSTVKLQTQWIRSYFSHVSFRVSKTVIIGLPHHGDGIRSTWASRFDWIFAARKIGYDGWTWVGVAHRAGGASYGLLQICRCTFPVFLVRKGGG